MSDANYKTYQIQIKKGHRLYSYCQTMCQNAKKTYHTTNFYIRQVYTAMTTTKKLHPLQEEVLDVMNKSLNDMNQKQQETYQKRLAKETAKPQEERKNIKVNLFSAPTKDHPHVSYHFLDALFKHVAQSDYRSLPFKAVKLSCVSYFKTGNRFILP